MKVEDFEFYEEEFVDYLKNVRKCNERSIFGYVAKVRRFFKLYHTLNEETVNEYYEWLTDGKKAQTVNSYTLALNVYIHFLKRNIILNSTIFWEN